MSLSRVRSRAAAIAGALPVLLAASPVGVALAAGEYTVTNVVDAGQVIGPNVGYLGHGKGVSGTTAMFKVTVPSVNSTIESVTLTLTNDNAAFNLARDVTDGDGLALYADVDGDATTFGTRDKAEGIKSTNYSVDKPDASGNVPVRLSMGTGASGSQTYWITIRPNTSALTGQQVRFEVPAGGVSGSGGDGPSNTASTPSGADRMVMDSKRPTTAPSSAFIVDEEFAGTEDAYLVAPSAASSEPSLEVIFFNHPVDTAPTNILRRPDFETEAAPESQPENLAIDTVINPSAPTQAHRIEIGDGTGIVPGVTTVAKNNQLGNNVYARLIDSAGNLSEPTKLSDCGAATTGACPAATADFPHNANNVVAPAAPTAVTIANGRINIATQAAQSVTATSDATAGGTRDATGAKSSDLTTPATKSRVVIASVGADGQPSNVRTPESNIGWVPSAAHTLNTTTPTVIPEGGVVAIAWNHDDLGNVSVAKVSSTVPKDITRPTLSVEFPSSATQGEPGDIVTLQFSEPMATSGIVATSPSVDGRCQPEAPNSTNTVSRVLRPEHLTSTDRTWGYNNCFAWSAGGRAATIELGDLSPICTIDPTCTTVLPGVGNKVFILGTQAAPKLTDANGNPAIGVSPAGDHSGYSLIVAPPTRPDPSVPAETRDLNTDGVLDGVVVTFTKGVNLPASFAAAQDNFSIVASGLTLPVTTAEWVNGDHKKVLLGFSSTFGTGVTPEVRLKAPAAGEPTGLVDDDSLPIPEFAIATVDAADPQIKSAHTVDVDKDGHLDQVIVTFTEPIDHALDHNNVAVNGTDVAQQPGGYRVVGYETLGGTRNRVTPQTGETDTKVIELAEKTAFDTGATPTVQWFGGAPLTPLDEDRAWYDAAGNKGPTGFSTSTTVPSVTKVAADQVAPRLVERRTGDLDADGRLDTIDLKWSETIPSRTTGSAYTVSGHAITDQFGLGTDGIRLVIDETAPRGRGDTGVKPTVQYLSGMDDGLGNVSPPDTAGVASIDKAPPAIVGACVSSPKGSNGLCPEDDPANDGTGNPDKGDKLNVFFSETILASTSAVADYKVEQPQGTDKMNPAPTAGAPVTSGTGETAFSIVTLDWAAASTLDHLADAVVRLTGAGVITDNASNVSVQLSDVTAFAFPTIDLVVTCPVTANAGFCSQLVVNVDTTSSSGVTLWRLAETARTATTADAEYTATMPTTYTFPAEGSYTLYLSGKDAYNRLTTEDSAPIRIIKSPTIENVQFVNSTPGVPGGWPKSSTVTDGDNLLIGADAYGSDAAEWASAPTGGGCFAQHMSIDARSVTGRSNFGTVAPLKCDLNVTNAVKPYRQMQFPVLRTSNTTRYPVGTVLKTSDSDPGSMIVDGPGGTHRRRAFISVAARRSWMISDASVIKVPSTLVNGIPRLRPNIGYRDGALLRSSTGYYLVYRSQKRPVSTAQLSAWRITTRMAYRPTAAELRAHSTGSRLTGSRHPAGVWIKYSNGTIYQVVRNKSGVNVRRKLASRAALQTLVPYGHVVPAVSADSQMPVDSWLRGYRDGTLLKRSGGTFAIVSRGSLRNFANAATFNSMGFNASNALPANGAAMPRVNGQGYRTGVAIDRYKITTVVIKVTNKAGAVVTATIVPSFGGLFALGTFDPAPSGWDFTR